MAQVDVIFRKNAKAYGYAGKPGEPGTVHEEDLAYLIANGVVELAYQVVDSEIQKKKFSLLAWLKKLFTKR